MKDYFEVGGLWINQIYDVIGGIWYGELMGLNSYNNKVVLF